MLFYNSTYLSFFWEFMFFEKQESNPVISRKLSTWSYWCPSTFNQLISIQLECLEITTKIDRRSWWGQKDHSWARSRNRMFLIKKFTARNYYTSITQRRFHGSIFLYSCHIRISYLWKWWSFDSESLIDFDFLVKWRWILIHHRKLLKNFKNFFLLRFI